MRDGTAFTGRRQREPPEKSRITVTPAPRTVKLGSCRAVDKFWVDNALSKRGFRVAGKLRYITRYGVKYRAGMRSVYDGLIAEGDRILSTKIPILPLRCAIRLQSSRVHVERHAAEPFARGGKDGVCNGRPREPHSRLPQSVRIGRAVDKIGFKRRRLGHAQQRVVVKILLFGGAVADGDGFLQHCAHGEQHASLELRTRAVGID